jgi:hypothetical protein
VLLPLYGALGPLGYRHAAPSETANLSSGLVSAFLFEESPYTDSVDAGTLTDGAAPPVSGAGKNNLGLSSAGGDYVLSNNIDLSVSTGDFTYSFWFKMDPLAQADYFFVLIDALGAGYYAVQLSLTNVVQFTDLLDFNEDGTILVTAGVYHNLAVIYDEATTTSSVYLDGVLDQTFVLDLDVTSGPLQSIQIGSIVSTVIAWDELYFWSRKLNVTEITALQTQFYPF